MHAARRPAATVDSESPTGESTPVHGLNSLLGISWAAERNGDGRRADLLSQGAGRQGPGQGVGTQKRKGGAGGRGRGIWGVCTAAAARRPGRLGSRAGADAPPSSPVRRRSLAAATAGRPEPGSAGSLSRPPVPAPPSPPAAAAVVVKLFHTSRPGRCAPSSLPARCRAAAPAPLRIGGEGGLQCVNVPCRPARRPRAATCGGAGGGAQPAGPANPLARGKGGAGGNREGGGEGEEERKREGEGEGAVWALWGEGLAERRGGASSFGGTGGASGRRQQCGQRGLL